MMDNSSIRSPSNKTSNKIDTVDRSLDNTLDNPISKTSNKSSNKSSNKTLDDTTNKTSSVANKSLDKSLDKSSNKTLDNTINKTFDEAVDEILNGGSDEILDNIVNNIVDKTPNKISEKGPEKGSLKTLHKPLHKPQPPPTPSTPPTPPTPPTLILHNCPICLEDILEDILENTLIKTPCDHPFHKDCISNLMTPTCPVCRKNITTFLLENNLIQKHIMKKREFERISDLTHEKHKLYLDTTPPEDESFSEYNKTAYSSFMLNPSKVIFVYRDIIFDLVKNAAHLFCKYSELKHKDDNPGIFYYYFDDFLETLVYLSDHNSRSTIMWRPLKYFQYNKAFKKVALNAHSQIKNTSDEFVMMIAWDFDELESTYCSVTRFTSTPAKRPQHNDILNSIRSGVSLRTPPTRNSCSLHSSRPQSSPNREYEWAYDKLKYLDVKVHKDVDYGIKWNHEQISDPSSKAHEFYKSFSKQF